MGAATIHLAGIIPAFAQDNIWLIIALKFFLVATVFIGGVSLIAMGAIWAERKIAGHAQGRLGPKHVGPYGLLQSLADGIKLIQKEDLIPDGADSLLFRMAPYLAFAPVFAAFVALPFGPQLCFEGGLQNGLLYILAVLSVEVMAVILAGWGSNSKWAVYGAMREACQMVSYEVPLGLALICGVITAGTLNLVELGYLQGGGIQDWFFYHNPFIFVAFFTYFVASLASCKRAPFDLPESESELVAGFHTEYSGMRFSFFFFAEYAGMFVVGAISAFLFLGGWNSPLGPIDPLYLICGWDPIHAGEVYMSGALSQARGWNETAELLGVGSLQLLVINLYGLFWVALKALSLVFVHIWLRWTLPRIRIDQVMYICIKVLLPLSLVLLVGTAAWVYVVPQAQGPVVEGVTLHHWGHLLGDTPIVQLATQLVLTALGLGVTGAGLLVVFKAWLDRDRAPRQSFFNEEMPVGNEIAFNPGAAPEG